VFKAAALWPGDSRSVRAQITVIKLGRLKRWEEMVLLNPIDGTIRAENNRTFKSFPAKVNRFARKRSRHNLLAKCRNGTETNGYIHCQHAR
jgi:hypothetical protein